MWPRLSGISGRRAVHDEGGSGSGAQRAAGRCAVFVKICGITRLEDAQAAVTCGERSLRALGFVFWPKSPRYIEPARAKQIVETLLPSVAAVGVFVDQPVDEVNGIAEEVNLDFVQLHGDESDDYIAKMIRPVIKAIGIAKESVPPMSKWPKNVRVLLD